MICGRIIRGEKNCTRRLTAHRDGKPLRCQAGRSYALQPVRGKRHIGHIAVAYEGARECCAPFVDEVVA